MVANQNISNHIKKSFKFDKSPIDLNEDSTNKFIIFFMTIYFAILVLHLAILMIKTVYGKTNCRKFSYSIFAQLFFLIENIIICLTFYYLLLLDANNNLLVQFWDIAFFKFLSLSLYILNLRYINFKAYKILLFLVVFVDLLGGISWYFVLNSDYLYLCYLGMISVGTLFIAVKFNGTIANALDLLLTAADSESEEDDFYEDVTVYYGS